MTRRHLFAAGTCLSASAAVLLLAGIRSAAQTQQGLPPERGNEVAEGEVLTSGPMHEAFAKALPANPEPGIVVPHQPPEPIEEIPPDQRPQEEEAVWIPGYWGWDENHKGFVWISGVWRVPPPGAEWVPGYWAKAEDGYQWIAGYWWYQEAPAAEEAVSQEVVYLPDPPATLEAGPSSPLPSEEHFWVPGCWMWHEVRYVWRPGYWAVGVPDWVWVPAHYVWSPSGCIFVAGHWDYTLERRGLLFAPVYFDRVVYTRPAFRYVPTVVINTTVLQTSLFVRPRYCHYYFGDYYAPAYRDAGIVAWFSFHGERRGYDPLFTYHYWRHGRDRTWLANLRQTYEYRAEHVEARPPRTFHEMHRWMERQPAEKTVRLAAHLHEVEEIKDMSVQLTRVDEQHRERYVRLKDQMREFTRQRANVERELHEHAPQQRGEEGRGDDRVATERKPQRAKLPESPFAQFRPDRGAPDVTGRRERAGRSDRQGADAGLAEERDASPPPRPKSESRPGQTEQTPADVARPEMPAQPGAVETATDRPDRDPARPDRAGRRPEPQPGAQPDTTQQTVEQPQAPQSPQTAMPDVPGLPSERSQRPDRAGAEGRLQRPGAEPAVQPGLPQQGLDQRPAMPEGPADSPPTSEQPRLPGSELPGRGPATERPSGAAEMPSPPQPGVAPQQPGITRPGLGDRTPGTDRQLQPPQRPEGSADPFGERGPRGRDRDPSLQRMPQAGPGAAGGTDRPTVPGLPSATDRPAADGQPADSLLNRPDRNTGRPGAGIRSQEGPPGLDRPQIPGPATGLDRPPVPPTRDAQPSPQLPGSGAQGFSPNRPPDMESGRRSRTPGGAPPTRSIPGLDQPQPDAQSPLPGVPGLESGRRARSGESRPDFRSRMDALQERQPPTQMPDVGRPPISPRSGSIPGLERSPQSAPGVVPGSPPSDLGGSRERSARSRGPEGPSAAPAERMERERPSESGRRERSGRSDRGRDRGDD